MIICFFSLCVMMQTFMSYSCIVNTISPKTYVVTMACDLSGALLANRGFCQWEVEAALGGFRGKINRRQSVGGKLPCNLSSGGQLLLHKMTLLIIMVESYALVMIASRRR